MADLTRTLRDSAYIAVGFGVIGVNRVQVGRRQLGRQLAGLRTRSGDLGGARDQVAGIVRTLDARLQPVRQELESNLDRVAERLPDQAREVVRTAREIARETELQVRKAVGV